MAGNAVLNVAYSHVGIFRLDDHYDFVLMVSVGFIDELHHVR